MDHKGKTAGICEMCGHHVGVRQKAHIFAEGKKAGGNLLMLCPSCHIMFDTHLKPKVFKALVDAGVRGLPKSWESSLYEQAAQASQPPNSVKNHNCYFNYPSGERYAGWTTDLGY
jgi:hypothetical protein